MEHLGVCVIILNKDGKILLGKRKNGYGEGQYGIPGGRVEENERLAECAKRELVEEVGLKIELLEYIGVVREFQKTYNFIHFGFVARDVTDQISNLEPDKCEGWEWVDMNNLPENILAGHKAMMHLYSIGGAMAEII